MKTGSADLPLHGGHVPAWLASRMARLGRVVVEALVLEYGRDEVLRRLASPFWFQSLGCVMGMDWHSSGITTSVLGALKRGLGPVQWELGLHVCGGRGRHSRNTPAELLAVGERVSVDAPGLVRASRLVAKVDSAAVQDGFDLYLHGFVVTDDGKWAVVQQGMNPERRQARRYHWLWDRAGSFVDQPHAAIEGIPEGSIVNFTDRQAAAARDVTVALACEPPESVVAQVQGVARLSRGEPAGSADGVPSREGMGTLPGFPCRCGEPAGSAGGVPSREGMGTLPGFPCRCQMPAHHDVRRKDVNLRRLAAALRVASERGPADFPELLLTPGIGGRTLFALSLVAEVVHGAPTRFSDPARFSFAHGGKDGHPFPVPLDIYDETLRVLRRAVDRAKLGQDDKLAALRRLDDQCRMLESAGAGTPVLSLPALVAEQRSRAPEWNGRTCRDDAARLPRQLRLPF